MSNSDGGGAAAFGFRYQYLATAEEFLLAVTTHSADQSNLTLIVEPIRPDLRALTDDDIVDFAIEIAGDVSRRVQVKSSRAPSGRNPLRYADVRTIFERMGSGGDHAAVLTNKPLAKKLRRACAEPSRSSRDQDVYLATADVLTSGQAIPARSIVLDKRSPADIKQSVLTLIRDIRGDHALGRGEKSAALLAALLLDTLFESGADLAPRRFSGQDIVELLCTPDGEIAHALREFDWGVPLLEVPHRASPVPRSAELAELSGLFTVSVEGREPAVAVLAGVTGFGKSTIAADFCHLNRHFYEEVLWIDSRTDDLIQAKIKDTLTRLGVDVSVVHDVASAFRTRIATLAGPFVLVFDGARSRQDIAPYLPTSGCGFVIVTSTNSTGWWSTAHELHIASFTENESIACFEAYARLEPGDHTTAVRAIVNRLEQVPLAIAMAASYFRNADEDIGRLSREYFERLDALNESTSIPEGFDKTAFSAIRFAVEQIGTADGDSAEERSQTMALVYHSAFLAPELIPLNLLLQTVEQTVTIDLTEPPKPEFADQHRRNGVLVKLRTQTLAQLRSYIDASGEVNPASDTINIHPLVHEILRAIHSRLAPPGRLVDLLTVLMTCTFGWIRDLRHDGKFFPVEQLLVHGQEILDLVDTVAIPEDADPDHIYVFQCARFYLRFEIANCIASRGDYERSIDLIELGLDQIDGVTLTRHAQFTTAKAASDAVADAMLGGLEIDRVMNLATRAIAELRKFDTIGGPQRGDLIVAMAIQVGQSLSNVDADGAQSLIDQLGEIATRQTISTTPDAVRIQTIQHFLSNGGDVQALQIIQQARESSPSVYEQVMLDTFEAIAYLHLHRFTPAAVAIDRILRGGGDGEQMKAHLQMACKDIGVALQATKSAWMGRSGRLQAQQRELQDLAQRVSG